MSIQINDAHLRQAKSIGGYNTKKFIIIHHPEFNGSVTALNNMMINMGFSMIGYNFYIRKDGTIYKGRPLDVYSANCYNYNSKSIGVCCEGCYDKETTMPDAQYKSLVELVKYLANTYNIPRNTNYINGHSHFYNTSCPGKYFPITRALKDICGGSANVTVTNNTVNETGATQYDRAKVYNQSKNVKHIQECLIKAGYSLPKYGADGSFGRETFDAILRFQKNNKCKLIDGMVGSETMRLLESKAKVDRGISTTTAKFLQNALIKAGYSLPKYGADGSIGNETREAAKKVLLLPNNNYSELVKALQLILLDKGYSLPKYGADGYYGETTINAVKDFQSNNGLSVDGKCGQNTWAKILL